jgi:hypothetical protein
VRVEHSTTSKIANSLKMIDLDALDASSVPSGGARIEPSTPSIERARAPQISDAELLRPFSPRHARGNERLRQHRLWRPSAAPRVGGPKIRAGAI